MTRTHWLVVLIALIELGAIAARPSASRAVLRTVYEFCWSIAPKPAGYEPPPRFR